jgi:NAD(P)-dependent dehydrogenase (short-subunit alcohol dehydrogenase family)
LTADYSRYGIRFNVVAVGSVPAHSETWIKRFDGDPLLKDRLDRLYPMGRVGEPEDICGAIVFLASEEAAWITGVVLPVDGGLTATGALPGGRWWESHGDVG